MFQYEVKKFLESQGSVAYQGPSVIGGNVSLPFAGAKNGVSQDGAGNVVLGNDTGASLAALISNRDLPMAGFNLKFTQVGQTATGVPTFKEDPAILGNTPDLLFQQSDGQESGRIRFLSSVGGDAGDIMMGRLAGNGITTVDSRMFFGWRSGELATNAALGSTAFGYETLRLVTGINNHAFGTQALHNITSGANNCGIGKNCVLNADILNNGVFIGNFTGPAVWAGRACDNNTFIGFGAGQATGAVAFTATKNTFIGSLVAQSAAAGYTDSNTIIGYNSCNGGGFTSNNTLIGANVVLSGGLSNVSIIGQGISCSLANVSILSRTDQNAIIGNTIPGSDLGAKLQVYGNISAQVISQGSNFTVTNNAHTYLLTAGGLVVTLPAAASGNQGWIVALVNQAAASTTSINYTNFAGAAVNTLAANSTTWLQSTGVTWNRIV